MDSGNITRNSVLLLHQGALGDFILSIPSLLAIQRRHLNPRLQIALKPSLLPLLSCLPPGFQGISLNHPGIVRLWMKGGSSNPAFGPFDAVYAFSAGSDEVLVENLNRLSREPACLLPALPPGLHRIHALEFQRSVLEDLGIQAQIAPPRLQPTREALQWAEEWLFLHGELKQSPVAVHMGSGGISKNWPVERFVQLIRCTVEQQGIPVLVVWGPVEEERGIKQSVLPNARMARNFPLDRVAALLRLSRGYIGNDSGVTHLAAAVGTPTLALFGPTDPEVWAPRGDHVVVIKKGDTMSQLPVETVKEQGAAFWSSLGGG